MKLYHFTPKNGNGMDVVLYWQGPGWYGPISRGDAVEEHPIDGFDEDGFAIDEEDCERCPRIWDYPSGLGTPGWLESPEEYSPNYIPA